MIADIYEISPMQRAMLFHAAYAPRSTAHFNQFSCKLSGPLEPALFRRAWERLVERHGVLRTSFHWEGLDKPVQVVHDAATLPWTVHDWRHLDRGAQQAHWREHLRADLETGFVLERPPLMRCTLVRTAESEYLFNWSHHHIITDGWCLSLMLEELFKTYDALVARRAPDLPPPASYRTYIEWLQRQDAEKARAFWADYLKGFRAATELPALREKTPGRREADSVVGCELPEELGRSLRLMANRHHVTPSIVVQGAWALLLSRYSGECDVVFGTTVSGRPTDLPGVGDMLGLFINTVPVRVQVEYEAVLIDWLRQIQAHQAERTPYEYSPLSDIQQWSDVPRGTPLFNSNVIFMNYPLNESLTRRAGGLFISELQIYDRTDIPLQLQVTPGSRWTVELAYDEAVGEETALRLLAGLRALLSSFVAAPARPLRELALLPPAERRALLDSTLPAPAPFDPSDSLVSRLERLAAKDPEAPAVSRAGRTLSRRRLNARANRLARLLLALRPGLGPDRVVALLLDRSERLMAAALAAWKCAAAYLPLDPSDPPARLREMLLRAGAEVLVTESGRLPAGLAEGLAEGLSILDLDAEAARWEEGDDSAPDSCDLKLAHHPASVAYLIYTSGSTGAPKGVMVEHRGMLNHLLAKVADLGLCPSSAVAQTASQCFDISVWQLFAGPLAGGRTVVYGDEAVMEPARLLAGCEEDGVTVLEVVPSYLAALLARMGERPAALRGLTHLLVTGEAVSPALVADWFAHSDVPVVNAYGPTECSDDVTHHVMEGPAAGAVVPAGRALGGLRVYVLDEWGGLCPEGVKGEVCVGGVGVGRGYVGEAGRTAEAFCPDPYAEERGGRLYRTGDVGSWGGGGVLLLHGRRDQQVKVRGHRIELGEVEHALTRLECVHEAVVRDLQDEGGRKYLCGYVTLRPGEETDAASLARELSTLLPDYMVPSAFVLLDKLPLTPNGKVDRRALPTPDLSKEVGKAGYAAPRTAIERELCRIWGEVLRIERPSIHDNFFALGGDSILSMQIVSRAARSGLTLLTSQVFEYQTVAELARIATPAARPPSQAGELRGLLPLTPIQRRFFLQRKVEAHHYNQSLMIEASEGFDPALMRRALRAVVAHHDALRLRFRQDGGDWYQQVTPAEEVSESPLRVEDLALLSPDEQGRRLEEVCAEAHAGLDLSSGPLLRACLFTEGEGRKSRLLLVAHHLVIDGVSWRILLEDLATLYEQLRAGAEPTLPDRTTTFGQWAASLAETARADVDLDREHWRSVEAAPTAPLPLDEAGGPEANVVGSAAEVTSVLDAEATASLLQQAARAYNTRVNDLLLAALALTLQAWTGDGEVRVELEGHGREPWVEGADLSRTVGWFTTLFPVRLHVPAGGPASLIKSVKEQLRLVPHNGLTYGLLRYLSEERAVDGRPAAEVVFNYLGRMDSLLPGGSKWALAADTAGAGRAPGQRREYLLEINSYVLDGRLHTSWGYSRNLHREATVRRLAENYRAHLAKLIAHCLEPEAFGLTPSDFPSARASQSALDELSRQLKTAAGAALRDEIEDVYELTPTQQGMLFHGLYAPSSDAYFNQLSCLIEGELDAAAFREAWRQTVERHPILRTSFHWDGLEKPLQVVHRQVELRWDALDLSGVEEAEALERWRALLRRERALGFKTSEAPLMRWTLANLGGSRWRFNWSQHHLLLDGWSSSLVLGEVLETYAALHQGREPALPHPRPFREMVGWLQRQDASRAERFWREKLAGFQTPTPLVLGRPEMEGGRGPELYAERELFVSSEATARLVSFAQQNRLSLNTLSQSAWSLLLTRYSGEPDVVHGTIVSGRPPELEGSDEMVGLFINSVPVRVRLDESEAAASLLNRVQADLAEQEQHAHSPLADIQSWSEVPGGTPLFESLFIFQNYPVGEALDGGGPAGVRVSDFQVFDPNNYPLTLVLTPGERLSLRVLYDAGRFDEETIERLLGHYQTLLAALADAPGQPVGKVELLTPAERARILSEWNQTAAEVPAGQTLVDLFESHAAATPDRVALVCGNVSRTYRELRERSDALARRLQEAAAVEPNDRVALFLHRSEGLAEAILAVWKCGAAYVPVDPSYPAERVERILEDARPRLILVESAAALADLKVSATVVGLDSLPPHAPAAVRPASKASPRGLAYVIYTSGSTGRPKGAMVEHRGMLNHVLGMARDLELTEESAVAQTASHCFDISIWQLFAALAVGGRTHVYPEGVVLRPAELARGLDRDGVTVAQFVPSYLAAFTDEVRTAAPPRPPLSRLRFMVTIGEILKPSYVAEWFALYPGVKMMNAYGPTEASDSITHFVMDAPPSLTSIPVGRPVQNLKIYVLDQSMRLCPVGVRGEICVAGVGVGRGYLFDAARTAAAFTPDPFDDAGGGRLYHTGDVGCYAPDGQILFFGRKDQQVKIRGHRVELGDVESAVTAVEGVSNAAVLAREDERGLLYLCAYVSRSEGDGWSAASLRDAVRAKLPAHMLPDTWVFLPELPVTPNGKVNRKALPAPEGRGASPSGRAAPATAAEEALASIWQDVLGREVGVEEHFFEAGGHSLHALQIVARIRRDLGVEAAIAQLFNAGTVRALARELSNSAPRAAATIPALPARDWHAVSHAQKRIWLACRTAEASVAYNMAAAFRLDGPLDANALAEALHALVERHESLRTVFALVGGELSQQVRDARRSGFRVTRLEAPANVDELVAAEAARPFDLAAGPPFRATLARVGEQSHVLLLTMHHVVSDAWSVRVLFRELRALYRASRSGGRPPLAPLAFQYRDYAAWHNRLLETEEMRAHLDYWKRVLRPEVPRLELPTDFPRASNGAGRKGGRVASLVAPETAERLSGLGRRHGTSLFGAVLASICVLLYRYTGRQEFVVGFQSAGRDRHELEDQVGVYLNTVLLRARVEPGATVAETVASVGATLLEALEHGSYPFDLLLEELRPKTPPDRSPLFDVQIDYVPDLEPARTDEADGLSVTDLSSDAPSTKYDVSFLLLESAAGLQVVTVYDAGLFRRETIETMHRRLAAIQRAFIEDETGGVGAIELFDAAARPAGRRVQVGLRLGAAKSEPPPETPPADARPN